jgi:methylase of polypeptide subunit release factors
MADDLAHKNAHIEKKPVLLCENAQNINKIPQKNIEGVITSPPYINGTNYFRNTKLELWFLGCLQKPDDLTAYRNRALTAGINTVSGEYEVPEVELVQQVVNDLEEHGYDRRLPLMVSGYCWELQKIFEKIESQLKEGAVVAIDIGDSIYAGVHVPADKMIVQLLEQLNYDLIDTVKLRDRHSNNGEELKQVLLIFEYEG